MFTLVLPVFFYILNTWPFLTQQESFCWVLKTQVFVLPNPTALLLSTLQKLVFLYVPKNNSLYSHYQTRQITASWLTCNHQVLCKGIKRFYCNVVNNIPTISVCKLSCTCITLKTVESCINPRKFYSEITITMITVKYFWPQNSVVKEPWFCCNWKFTLKCICFVRNLIGQAF